MPIFRLTKEEKLETWWKDWYEIQADTLEQAVEIVKSGEVDPYDVESFVDLQAEPTAVEIYDSEGNLVYESR
jgi:hypothetical protein